MCSYDSLIGKENATANHESRKGKIQTHTHIITAQQHIDKTNITYPNPTNANLAIKPHNQKTTYIIDTTPQTNTSVLLDLQPKYPSSIGEIGEFKPKEQIKYIEPITTVSTKTINDPTNIPDSWLKLTA